VKNLTPKKMNGVIGCLLAISQFVIGSGTEHRTVTGPGTTVGPDQDEAGANADESTVVPHSIRTAIDAVVDRTGRIDDDALD